MKKIFLGMFLFFGSISGVFGYTERVEDIFIDIDSDYIYINQLQALYERGMILSNESGIFGPNQYLNRDEFVGISMEVNCEKCVQPYTDFGVVEKYFGEEIYFDLDTRNPYFYCIAEADTQNFVRGYDIGESCQNGDMQLGERPFCPTNFITREEAIAVLLRNSGIYTIDDNRQTIQAIDTGIISQNIANDVGPKNTDGSANTFYGYLEKALNYEIIEYDTDGNQATYQLIEPDSDLNLNPQDFVTKEDFLKMAYIIFTSNSCVSSQENNLATKIDIYTAICEPNSESCELSNLDVENNIYDFFGKTDGLFEEGINEFTGYKWRFLNTSTGEEFLRTGKYLDDVTLETKGKWFISLHTQDTSGNTGYASSFVVYGNNGSEQGNIGNIGNDTENINQEINIEVGANGGIISRDTIPFIFGKSDIQALSTNITARQIFGYTDFIGKFDIQVNGGSGSYSYLWDFGDGQNGVGKNVEHVYKQGGIYTLRLEARDDTGNTGSSEITIQVLDGDSCLQDADGDTIFDCEDLCPLVSGSSQNSGCPILYERCDNSCGCSDGYSCDSSDTATCSVSGVCIPNLENSLLSRESCLYSEGSGNIFGNTTCTTCPCDTQLDFLADIRPCDILFPAITSPDGLEIYSQGDLFEMK